MHYPVLANANSISQTLDESTSFNGQTDDFYDEDSLTVSRLICLDIRHYCNANPDN